MKSTRTLALLLLIGVTVCACSRKQPAKAEKLFKVEMKTLPGDTTIEAGFMLRGYFVLLNSAGKLLVVDTGFNYVDSLSLRLAGKSYWFLNRLNDTLFLQTARDRKLHFIDTTFTVRPYQKQTYTGYGLSDFEDSAYKVTSCSVGEFGATVFFLNKKTNQTYAFPTTTVQQVLYHDGHYVVTNYLAHMSGFSDFLWIKDPTQLYELKDNKQKNHCNWWVEVDSLSSQSFEKDLPNGVRFYKDTFTTRTLVSFQHDNRLFSIYSTDSATLLGELVDFKLRPIDTLVKQEHYPYHTATDIHNGTVLTAYSASWATGEDGWVRHYETTGLICIRGDKITFLRFKTPHTKFP